VDAAALRRARRVPVIGTMIALAQWNSACTCARRSPRAASPRPTSKEVILQQAIYCGVPAANHAFKGAAEVMAELAKK
jgi:4-carboxymuconolactone decarboxylase